jgi:hypothetical protein
MQKNGRSMAETTMNDSHTLALIEQAKLERQRLLQQIEDSQKTIERSRYIIERLDEQIKHLVGECGSGGSANADVSNGEPQQHEADRPFIRQYR